MMTITEKLTQLLYSMVRIRKIEEAIAARYAEGKMRCPTHLSIGQECVGAALGVVLNKSDLIVSGHRAHAHYLGKGGNLERMLAEIYGKQTGCSAGKGGSMHLADPTAGFMGSTAIVANSIPVGVGLALSATLKGSEQICGCCFGDGAVEEGSFYESANFAALKKLPVLFICENNYYSVYSPLSVRQPEGREIYKLAEAIGLTSYKIDGNDAEQVLNTLEQAAAFCRSGQGPVFIELTTYRWREHCGPNYDNDLGYRSNAEFEYWQKCDPIARLKQRLNLSAEQTQEFDHLSTQIDNEVESAFEFAETSPFPSTESRQLHVYQRECEL